MKISPVHQSWESTAQLRQLQRPKATVLPTFTACSHRRRHVYDNFKHLYHNVCIVENMPKNDIKKLSEKRTNLLPKNTVKSGSKG